MNTLKALEFGITKLLALLLFLILAVVAPNSLLAQQITTAQSQTALSPSMQDSLAPVTYRNAMVENLVVVQASNMVERAGGNSGRRLKVFRVRNMNMALLQREQSFLVVKGSTSRVNGALTLAGTVFQTEMNESLAAWAQLLSMAATRKVSAEFAYVEQINKSSRFDSVMVYKLRSDSNAGKPEMIASIRYGIKF